MLVGSKDLIAEARVHRKALGGGMRQAGVLAAAGLIALDEGPARLAEDHANARLLAEAVADYARIDLDTVQTNIVIFEVPDAPRRGSRNCARPGSPRAPSDPRACASSRTAT